MFKKGDKVRILEKTVGNYTLKRVGLKIGDVVTIKRAHHTYRNTLSYRIYEGRCNPIFAPKDLKLLDHQERLNRKYLCSKKTI